MASFSRHRQNSDGGSRRPLSSLWINRQGGRFGALVLCWILLWGAGCGEPLKDAERLQSEGQWEESIEPIKSLLADDPDNLRLQYLHGLALVKTGQPNSAIWPLRKALKDPDLKLEVLTALLMAYTGTGSPDETIEAANEILALDPDFVEALIPRYGALKQAGREEESLEDIEALIELRPNVMQFKLDRLRSLLVLERLDEVDSLLESLLAESEADDGIMLASDRARICSIHAAYQDALEQFDTAEETIVNCLDEHGTDPGFVQETMSFFDRRRQYQRSDELLEAAYESETDLFLIPWATRLAFRGHFDRGEALLLAAAAENPESAPHMQVLMDFYVSFEKWDQVVKWMKALMDQLPEVTPMQKFVYADHLFEAGDLKSARDLGSELESPFSELIAGKALLQEGRPEEALAQLEEGIRLWPNGVVARRLAGKAAEQMGDFGRALEEYRAAFRAEPTDPQAVMDLMKLHMALGDLEQALYMLNVYKRKAEPTGDVLLLQIELARQLQSGRALQQLLQQLFEQPGMASRAMEEIYKEVFSRQGPEAALQGLESMPVNFSNPLNSDILRLWIQLKGQTEEAGEALEVVEGLIQESDEARAHLHESHAAALRASGAPPDQVRAAAERSVEIDPKRPSAWLLLAEQAFSRGEMVESIAHYDRATEADSEGVTGRWGAISLMLKKEKSDRDEAEIEERLTQLLLADPLSMRVAREMADLLLGQGRVEEAREFAVRCIMLQGRENCALLAAQSEIALGEPEVALRVLAIPPEMEESQLTPRVLYWRSKALQQLGRLEEAEQSLGYALSKGDFPEKEAGKVFLSELRSVSAGRSE